MKNVASNEDIRHRWNGHRRNRKAVKLYKKEAGCCGRFAYLLFGDVDQVQGRSRLQKYAELVETFYEIQKLNDGQPLSPIVKTETQKNIKDYDLEIEEQLLAESEIESSALSAPNPRLIEL